MKLYIEKLRALLEEKPPDLGNSSSVLAFLYEAYSEMNNLDNAQITVLFSAYSQYCAQRGIPCGEMAGFIRLAKKLFPTEGNARVQHQGVQKRGLPGVRFTNIST